MTLKNHKGFVRYFKKTPAGRWLSKFCLSSSAFGSREIPAWNNLVFISYVLTFTAIFGGIVRLGLEHDIGLKSSPSCEKG